MILTARNKTIIAVFVVFAVILVTVPALAIAQNESSIGTDRPTDPDFQLVPCNGPDCEFGHVVTLAKRIINFLLYVAVFIGIIAIMYAGFVYVSSAGDTGKVDQAHTIFKNVLFGFIIALGAWLIVHAIISGLGAGQDYSGLG